MPIEYDSKVIIRRMKDDRYKDGYVYEVCWNVNSSILSVLTDDQMCELIQALEEMRKATSGPATFYRLPIMRHTVTG